MKFDYKKVDDLGFQREDYKDSLHYSEYGWQPFWMTLNLTKKISMNWDCETKEITMLRCNKEHDVLGKIKIQSEDQLHELLVFFGLFEPPKVKSCIVNAC